MSRLPLAEASTVWENECVVVVTGVLKWRGQPVLEQGEGDNDDGGGEDCFHFSSCVALLLKNKDLWGH